jgi:hypothetical protein
VLTLKDFSLKQKQKLKEMRNDCERNIKEYLAKPEQFLAEEEEEEMGVVNGR